MSSEGNAAEDTDVVETVTKFPHLRFACSASHPAILVGIAASTLDQCKYSKSMRLCRDEVLHHI